MQNFFCGFLLFLASCNAICFTEKVDCQVFLTGLQRNPYRNLLPSHAGWYYAGQAKIESCWNKDSDSCAPCRDSVQEREQACQKLHKGFTTRHTPYLLKKNK